MTNPITRIFSGQRANPGREAQNGETQDWENWFVAAGLDYVEVERCPDLGCGVCSAAGERVAA